jgi:hypothetical protein
MRAMFLALFSLCASGRIVLLKVAEEGVVRKMALRSEMG